MSKFTEQTYRTFFEKLGYTDGTYDIKTMTVQKMLSLFIGYSLLAAKC